MIALLGACAAPELAPAGRPAAVPGVVLLAEISHDVVTVEGVLDGIDQWIDLDGGGDDGDGGRDDRYGFRYQVLDGDGQVLMERSTVGPALVESFLDYWSAIAGIDILQSLPTLGRFPLVVPKLDDAAWVQLQVRGEDGQYADRGLWSYDHLDDPRIAPSVVPDRVEVLHRGGGVVGTGRDSLDVVVLPDGYTADELDLFASDAEKVANRLLATEPFASYADRISITRADVPSAQSGAAYECGTCGFVDNAFGSIFPIEVVNRITGGGYPNRPMFQAEQWKVAEALAELPWDVVVVVVNSETYGGMAVHYATVTRADGDFGPTAVHEIGHAFGLLGDEYVFDDCVRAPGMPLPENVTDRPDAPPWIAHVSSETPLPTPAGSGFPVGSYEGAWNCADLYRPSESCKMNDSAGPFCPVCAELLERRLMRFGDPAGEVRIAGRDVVVVGALPDTVARVWADGVQVGEGPPDALPPIPRGAGQVEVELTWEPGSVLSDPHHDLQETWSFVRQ